MPRVPYYLGYGLTHAIALEGALKLKVITYAHCQGIFFSVFKYGLCRRDSSRLMEGTMDLNNLTTVMAANAARIQALVQGVSEQQAGWKPDPASWSLLEVVNHLWDEERLDFRVRLDITLHRPDQPWPPIDPGGWVTERAYNQRALGPSLEGYLSEREASLAWLRRLESPQWEASYQAPWGPVRAGDLMAAWLAHDLLHMRQLVELHWAYTTAALDPYDVRYAGTW